jgi:hypothetical protein
MEAEMKWMRWIIVLGVFSAQNYALAQDAKLVDAAKKEGAKVVIYGSLETPVVEGVIQAFRKKTGISAEYWRASAMSVMNRAMTEYRAGKPGYDVVLNNSDPLVIMANDGMLAQYDSPTAKKYPKDQIDPRFGPITRYGIVGIVLSQGIGQTGRCAQSDRGSRQSKIQRDDGDGRSDVARNYDPMAEQPA